jgi:diadenosine tetraphosphatase ApaH/serine/threonine PP2A family protein phosphatase
MVAGCQADIVCVGHTHVPFVRAVGKVTVINPGPVSNPLAPDLRAAYAILDADTNGFIVSQQRVEYDHQAAIEAIRRSNHPAARFIIDHQLGNRTVEGMISAAEARRHMIQSTG